MTKPLNVLSDLYSRLEHVEAIASRSRSYVGIATYTSGELFDLLNPDVPTADGSVIGAGGVITYAPTGQQFLLSAIQRASSTQLILICHAVDDTLAAGTYTFSTSTWPVEYGVSSQTYHVETLTW